MRPSGDRLLARKDYENPKNLALPRSVRHSGVG